MRRRPDSTIRSMARTALADFGVVPRRLTHLASRHNDIFRVDTITPDRFVLRIQNELMSDAQARSQLQWLDNLSKHSDLTVPTPIRTSDDRPFTTIETDNGKWRAVLLRWLPGRMARVRDERTYRAAAQMIARMHNHAENFRLPRGSSFRKLDGDWLFGPRFFVRAANSCRHLDASDRKIAATAEKIVRDAMEKLGHHNRRFGVIHADLNLDNIIFHRGRAGPIDFDEFGKGWYVFDLAELIRTSITPENFP